MEVGYCVVAAMPLCCAQGWNDDKDRVGYCCVGGLQNGVGHFVKSELLISRRIAQDEQL